MISTTVAVITLVVVLAALVVVAVGAGRTDDVDRYLTARDTQTVGRLSLAFLASGLGSWILFAPPEVGAQVGVLGVIGYAVGAAPPFAAYAWIGPKIRAAAPEGVTITDWVRQRFGRPAQAWVALVSIFYMFMFVTAELTAIGAVFDLVAGVDPWVPIVLVAVVTAAYTAYGGLPASLRTDQVESWMILLLVGITVGAILIHVDDPLEAARDGGLDTFSRAGWESIVVLAIAIVAANLFHQGYWQRTWAAADSRVVARAGWGAAGLTLLVLLAVGATGLVAAGVAAAAGEPVSAVPFFSLLDGVPDTVVVVALVMAVALVASSVDTLQSALAATLRQDLMDRRLSVNGARAARILLTVPAALIALKGYDVLRLFLIADLLAAATVGPVFLGLRREATGRGVIVGSAAGLLAVVVYGTIQGGSLADGFEMLTLPNGLDLGAFVWAPLVSTAVAIAVNRFAPQPTEVASVEQ
jgi:solute:Na+ symporter, SSS family